MTTNNLVTDEKRKIRIVHVVVILYYDVCCTRCRHDMSRLVQYNVYVIYAAGVILLDRKKTLLVVNRTRVVDGRLDQVFRTTRIENERQKINSNSLCRRFLHLHYVRRPTATGGDGFPCVLYAFYLVSG